MYEYRAKVKRIIDGDTIDFIVDLGFKINIEIRGRLLGVNTPERGHPDWATATYRCTDLLRSVATVEFIGDLERIEEEWYVTIRTEKTGKYGRWLVEIPGVTDVLAEEWPYGD